MKHMILILGLIGLIVSCHYETPDYYKVESYVCMWRNVVGADSGKQVFTPSRNNYIYLNATKLQDTAWFKVQAFGVHASKSRQVMFAQYFVEEEEGFSVPEAGVNFVPFDDKGLIDRMIIPADTAIAEIPVVVKYDPRSAGKKFHLYVHLVPTDDFNITTFAQCRGCVTFTNN